MVCLCQKGEKCSETAIGNFSKITEATESIHVAIHSISVVDYVTAILGFVCG